MLGKAVVLVVVSLLAVSLIVDSTLLSVVSAEPTTMGPISCSPGSVVQGKTGLITCCATETGQETGIEITWCTDCYGPLGVGESAANHPETLSGCSPRYSVPTGASNPSPNPNAGKYMRTPIGGILTGTTPLPPGSIIKLPPGTINAPLPSNNTGNATNPGPVTRIIPPGLLKPTGNLTNAPPATNNSTGNTIARGIGTSSPTGYCSTVSHYSCIPCDPGLRFGGCIPASEWPPSTSLQLGGKVTPPLGSIIKVSPGTTNALTPTNNGTGNATGTLPALTVTKEHNPSSPNILSLAPNATNPSNNTSTLKLSPLTGQTSGHHHHKGTSTASGNTNSTGH